LPLQLLAFPNTITITGFPYYSLLLQLLAFPITIAITITISPILP